MNAFREVVTWYSLVGLTLILLGIGAQKIKWKKKKTANFQEKENQIQTNNEEEKGEDL